MQALSCVRHCCHMPCLVATKMFCLRQTPVVTQNLCHDIGLKISIATKKAFVATQPRDPCRDTGLEKPCCVNVSTARARRLRLPSPGCVPGLKALSRHGRPCHDTGLEKPCRDRNFSVATKDPKWAVCTSSFPFFFPFNTP